MKIYNNGRPAAGRFLASATAFALTLSVFLSCFAPAAPAFGASNFVDTIGHWADEEIRAAVDYGYISGYPDGHFWPDVAIKRAEFVKIVNSTMGYGSYGNIAFRDVSPSDWFYDDIRKAAEAGYISGYDNGAWFAPNNPITREEVASVLYHIAPGASSTKAPKGLKDASTINTWALPAINSAYTKGFLSGYPDGNFYPQRNLTRAEAVKVINKVVGIDQASRAITELDTPDVTDTKTTFRATSRTGGTLFWTILKSGSAVPTATQISQGKDSRGETPIQKGSVKVTAYDPVTINVASLTPSTSYLFCAAVKGSDGKLSGIRVLSFSTRDSAAMGESWITTFNVGTITETSATLTIRASEKGTFYWMISERSSAGTPSQTDIGSGKDRDGDAALRSGSLAAARDKDYSVEVTGLKQGTNYYAYGYLSKSATEFSVVATRSFTTKGINPAVINSLAAAFNTDGDLEIKVKVNDPGTLYYVIAEEDGGALTPTADKVKKGELNVGQTLASAGNIVLVKDKLDVTVTKPALAPNKKYRLYATMEGGSGNLSSVVSTGLFEKSTIAAGLTGLAITANGGSITDFKFDPKVTEYNLKVPNGSSYAGRSLINVRPTAASGVDILLYSDPPVDGVPVKSGSSNGFMLPDPIGGVATPFTIRVETSEKGKAKTVYLFHLLENMPAVTSVYVVGGNEPNPRPDAAGDYAVTVPSDLRKVQVALGFDREMKGALVLNGLDHHRDGTRIALNSSGAKSGDITLNDGPVTVIQMEVYGPAPGGDVMTYDLVITKAP